MESTKYEGQRGIILSLLIPFYNSPLLFHVTVQLNT